jgi:hypothetical protein
VPSRRRGAPIRANRVSGRAAQTLRRHTDAGLLPRVVDSTRALDQKGTRPKHATRTKRAHLRRHRNIGCAIVTAFAAEAHMSSSAAAAGSAAPRLSIRSARRAGAPTPPLPSISRATKPPSYVKPSSMSTGRRRVPPSSPARKARPKPQSAIRAIRSTARGTAAGRGVRRSIRPGRGFGVGAWLEQVRFELVAGLDSEFAEGLA